MFGSQENIELSYSVERKPLLSSSDDFEKIEVSQVDSMIHGTFISFFSKNQLIIFSSDNLSSYVFSELKENDDKKLKLS